MDAFERELLEVAGQRSSVWHDARLGRFTASEFWKLMIEPKKKTESLSEQGKSYVVLKAAEILTGVVHQTPYAAPLAYGEEMEQQAVEYFEKKSNCKTESATFVHYGEHAGGSPDRYLGNAGLLEIKCPYNSENQVYYLQVKNQFQLRDEFRENYWQCQSNLLFTGRDYCILATYDPRMKNPDHILKTLTIEKDEDDQKLILEKLAFAIQYKEELLKSI